MRLARVLGPVWGARHAEGLDGAKLLRVEPLSLSPSGDSRRNDGDLPSGLTGSGAEVVAVDGLGAGPGELVVIAHGSRVRDLTVGERVCDKDVVVAIVDERDGVDVASAYGDASR